jgi:hypothetical protein
MTKLKALPLDFPVGTQENNSPHSVYPVPQPRFEPASSLTHTAAFRPKPTRLVIQGILDYIVHYIAHYFSRNKSYILGSLLTG